MICDTVTLLSPTLGLATSVNFGFPLKPYLNITKYTINIAGNLGFPLKLYLNMTKHTINVVGNLGFEAILKHDIACDVQGG